MAATAFVRSGSVSDRVCSIFASGDNGKPVYGDIIDEETEGRFVTSVIVLKQTLVMNSATKRGVKVKLKNQSSGKEDCMTFIEDAHTAPTQVFTGYCGGRHRDMSIMSSFVP
jgi:hypothetical protein